MECGGFFDLFKPRLCQAVWLRPRCGHGVAESVRGCRAARGHTPAFMNQEDESAVSWLLGQMQHVLPVYAYMGERRQTAGTLESSLGYYEVLAKEASDEAYIDEDGNLISAVEKSIEENEANRITINREKLMDYDYLVQNFSPD